MPTRRFDSDRSSLLADYGSTELGGGQDDHLPIGGPWNGYTFRGVVRFVLDWSTVKRIDSATLSVKTSSQVHIGFSSAPDIYVARATTSWSPNSASSSSEGGGGWSTSPVVYPGPSSTTTGRASKRMPTAENTWTTIDITAIVRAWAPTAVEGGAAAANYGVLMYYVASGDISEINSHTSTTPPYITLDYATDAPPVATPTGPTGTTTSKRPTITGTATDPDGDAIQSYGIEVRQGATVVHSATTGSGATLSYVPTADLPSGALTVRLRATAAGVLGAWSADLAFTIDRLPTVTAWSAPAATVSGTRRPVHTFSWSDADGDAGEVFDVEVYQDAGGGVAGTKVGGATNLPVAGGTSPCSWTPTVDLPGGSLLARSRVRTKGAWSAWSAYRAYIVVLTVPTLTWVFPTADGGYLDPDDGQLANAGVAILAVLQRYGITVAPPSGQTITKLHVKVVRLDGPLPGSVYTDADVTIPAAGGTWTSTLNPSAGSNAWTTPTGTASIEFTATASGAGVASELRTARFATGEWYGAVALGDQVTNLAAVETPKPPDKVAMLYRAQSSPTAANGAAVWQAIQNVSTIVQAGLPAANAYLGVRARIGRKLDEPNLVVNGSFEDPTMAGWASVGPDSVSTAWGTAPDGARILRILGDGVSAYPSVSQDFVPIPGATYRLSGWLNRSAGNATVYLRLDSVAANGAATIQVALTHNVTGGAWVYKEGFYTVPLDGSVPKIRVLCYIGESPATVDEIHLFDDVQLRGIIEGDSGMDRLDLSWKSLG